MFYLVNRISYSSPPCFLRCEHLFISPQSPAICSANGFGRTNYVTPSRKFACLTGASLWNRTPLLPPRAFASFTALNKYGWHLLRRQPYSCFIYLYICRSSSRAFTSLLLNARHRTECHRTWAPASSRRQRVPPWHRPRYARLPLQGQPHERSSSLLPEDRR